MTGDDGASRRGAVDEPLMPQDSVLRRIDDDLALSERRATREFFLGDAIDDVLTAGEALRERARDREARARGRPRLRRQVTWGLGFNTWPKGGRERIGFYLMLALAFAALIAAIRWIGAFLGA